MLDQTGDLHAVGHEGGHDIAEPVVPQVRRVVFERGVSLDVRPSVRPDESILALKVRVLHHEQPVGPDVL